MQETLGAPTLITLRLNDYTTRPALLRKLARIVAKVSKEHRPYHFGEALVKSPGIYAMDFSKFNGEEEFVYFWDVDSQGAYVCQVFFKHHEIGEGETTLNLDYAWWSANALKDWFYETDRSLKSVISENAIYISKGK